MKRYQYATLALFLTEVLIGAYVHDTIVRPYVGDLLVAILIYCFIKSFVNTPVLKTAICVLVICYTIETLQYVHLLNILGLQNVKLAHLILGDYFTWTDMLCYTIGIGIVVLIEALTPTHKPATAS